MKSLRSYEMPKELKSKFPNFGACFENFGSYFKSRYSCELNVERKLHLSINTYVKTVCG